MLALLILLAAAGIELLFEGRGSGSWFFSFSFSWIVRLASYGILAGIASLPIASEMVRPRSVEGWFAESRVSRLQLPTALRRSLGGIAALAPSLILLGPWGDIPTGAAFRMVLLIGSAFLASVLVPLPQVKQLPRVIVWVLFAAFLFAIAKRLVLVTDYPFKLGWSEGNRLWDYSLYFRWDQYEFLGESGFPTYLTPGRHGLWGLPFILPGVPIALVRLWDAVMWIVPYLLLSWLLIRRFIPGIGKLAKLAALSWIFLFMTLGGIFAPLVISVVLVVWAYGPRRTGRLMLVVGVAGIYAGLSRWTWLLAPAAWAVLLVLLGPGRERSQAERIKNGIVVGLVGVFGGLASQWIMAEAFPRPDPIFSTSLSQPLLWYRMLPNPTFPLGIVPALVLAVVPALVLLVWAARGWHVPWTRIEQGFIGVTVTVLIGAGMTASAKIGGGSNLHNADMLLVTILLLLAAAAGWILPRAEKAWRSLPEVGEALVVLVLLVPALDVVRSGGPLVLPPEEITRNALAVIRSEAETALDEGPVLFVDQRQLFTFGQIEDVPLVMDYELKDMMNQALSANDSYFERFHDDLAERRFSLILSDPLPSSLQGRGHQFGEENDAWYAHVASPLRVILEEIGVWLLEPIPVVGQ
jgi:hypothetical protein